MLNLPDGCVFAMLLGRAVTRRRNLSIASRKLPAFQDGAGVGWLGAWYDQRREGSETASSEILSFDVLTEQRRWRIDWGLGMMSHAKIVKHCKMGGGCVKGVGA